MQNISSGYWLLVLRAELTDNDNAQISALSEALVGFGISIRQTIPNLRVIIGGELVCHAT